MNPPDTAGRQFDKLNFIQP